MRKFQKRQNRLARVMLYLTGLKRGDILTVGDGCFMLFRIDFDYRRGDKSQIVAQLIVVGGKATCDSGHVFYESLDPINRRVRTIKNHYRRVA